MKVHQIKYPANPESIEVGEKEHGDDGDEKRFKKEENKGKRSFREYTSDEETLLKIDTHS